MDSDGHLREPAPAGGGAMIRFAAICVAVCAGIAALAACKPGIPKLDPAADPIARAFFDEVRTGADLDADTHLAHELKNPTTEQEIAQFRQVIPAEPPGLVELTAWDVKADNVGTTTRLTHRYHYGARVLIAQTALFKSPSGVDPVIVGFQVKESP
jgi:hypothetical protein